MTRQTSDHVFRELLYQVETHARGMWRYRWRAIWLAWAIFLACLVGIYNLPDVYEARARVHVDTENAITPLLEDVALSTNVLSEVNIVTREMLSRPNLANVARETSLDTRTRNESEFQDLVSALQQSINIDGGPEQIYTITYSDIDRDMAIAVVGSLVNLMVEESLGAERFNTSRAQEFLEKQIDEYEQRLTEAENRLATFKQDNVAIMPDQRIEYFTRLRLAEAALETTRDKLRLAQERRDELHRQIEGEEPVFGLGPGAASNSGQQGFAATKIAELELELESLRLRYTDKHPQIGQILETIEMLKEQQAQESAASSATAGPQAAANALDSNPVYQNMRIQLSNTEVDIAGLQVELRQQQTEVNLLRKSVDNIPMVEAELNRLNRDYDVIKTRYEVLVNKLETANIGDDIDKSNHDVQFRIIEPPYSGIEPTGPVRPMFLAVAMLGALAAAFGLTFILNQLHPVFHDRRTVRDVAGIPVLGVVALVRTEAAQRKARSDRRLLSALAVSLIAVFVLATLYEEPGSRLMRDLLASVI